MTGEEKNIVKLRKIVDNEKVIHKNVVEVLSDLLDQANSGGLKSIVVLAESTDGRVITGYAMPNEGTECNVFQLLGALQAYAYSLINRFTVI